jgi:hypothetical protein
MDDFPPDSRRQLKTKIDKAFPRPPQNPPDTNKDVERMLESFRAWLERERESWKTKLVSSAAYIKRDAVDYYFAKANEYATSDILDLYRQKRPFEPVRLDIMDLPSLSTRSTRILASYAAVNSLWGRAREDWSEAMTRGPQDDKRVPTFIILDEAHNIIPADPPGKPETILRDLFRTIIAEGRKYGLFLILVTQRPDKVDPMILSECDNVAVMRLNSKPIANKTASILGMNALSEKILQDCLRFDPGRVLLTGQWTPDGPRKMYTAARRTVEGGRNLRTEYWAHPEPPAGNDASGEKLVGADEAKGKQHPKGSVKAKTTKKTVNKK